MPQQPNDFRKKLGGEVASKFFGALYEEQPVSLPPDEFDVLASRLVSRIGGNTLVGDQALQSLLVNFVTSNATDLEQVKNLGASLAGIKQRALEDVAGAFPNANLDELVSAAREAGFDVEVLGRK